MPAPVKPGDLIEVPDSGYCFGSGPLRLHVTAADPPCRMDDNRLWQDIEGHPLNGDNTPIVGWDHRPVTRIATVRLDRVTQIPKQRRR